MDRCCGLDVHKDSVFLCILDENGKVFFEKRYGTLTPDLTQLRDTLVEHGCGQVAMESTSIYWKPIWRVLASDFSLKVENPYFIKQLPGRKSDVKDAQWLAECLQKELIRGSFVPHAVIEPMRQYTRQCRRLTKSMVRLEQQMDNQLQAANIRFSNYVTRQGTNVSMRKIIKAIIGGERDPVQLAKFVHGRTKNRHGIQTIIDSLDGVITDADKAMLTQCMDQLDLLEKQQAACLTSLEELANKRFAKEISLLCTIPGIQKFSAYCILSEIGNDMRQFGKASNLIGWAGLRPRNDESAGKIKSHKTLHGNKFLRQMLVEVSWSIARSNQTFLGKKFHHLSKRMKSQKALLSITRKLLVIIFNVLNTGQPFDPQRNLQALSA